MASPRFLGRALLRKGRCERRLAAELAQVAQGLLVEILVDHHGEGGPRQSLDEAGVEVLDPLIE